MDLFRLKNMLIRHEALRLKPYLCPEGKMTIGVGRNIEDNGIRQDEALLMLQNDINDSIDHLQKFSWFNSLSDVRQEVLVNLHFNIGHHSFLGFKNMITALENENYERAGDEMKDSKWYRQVGSRAVELVEAMKTNHIGG